MSSFLLVLLAAMIAQDPATPEPASEPTRSITVETLNGEKLAAESVAKLSRETIEVVTAEGPRSLATQDLQALRWSGAEAQAEAASALEIQLQDGSVLYPTSLAMRQRIVQVAASGLGELTIPGAAVRVIRLSPLEEVVANTWNDLVNREIKNDLLVIRKGDALEFVGGVIGEISEKDVKVLVRDREAAVPRERVFGVIFVRGPEPPPAVCEVQTLHGDRLRTREIQMEGDKLTIVSAGQPSLAIPVTEVAVIDFTLGRIKSLGDLPMEQKQHAESILLTPTVFEIRKDRTSLGQPLRIGDRDFTNGLWIHSGATGTFRLQRQYRKFTAVMGLDANSSELARVAPEVKVTISGDGKSLLETNVVWNDDPRPVDLDVSGVRELVIRVDSLQETPGILEHLDLGDARVIK